jgi:voltage-gated potassium channel
MQTFRHRLYQILENHHDGLLSKVVNIGLMLLIFGNIVAIVLSSETEIHKRYFSHFVSFEILSLIVFTIEYIARVWVSVESDKKGFAYPIKGRLRYMLTPMAIIDLLAILPTFFMMFLGSDWLILRSLRLIRVFKLTRYSRSMELLVTVMKQEAETIVSAIFILLILILISATGIHLVEGHIQPKEFGSIPRALWWSTVTLTTVGYGDVVPITMMGRIFGIIIVITGIGMAALPAGIMAAGFTSEINRRRERFKTKIMARIEDGILTRKGRRELEALRVTLGISRADAGLMISEVRNEEKRSSHLECPHCGKDVHVQHKSGQTRLGKRAAKI